MQETSNTHVDFSPPQQATTQQKYNEHVELSEKAQKPKN
jgi:hypothetical protein